MKQPSAPSHLSPTMAVVDANATVVVNIFTLEVAVEDISTEGEAKGLKTAHEALPEKTGWTRPYCFGGAVQKGTFRPVSGFLNGLREGYMAVTALGYDGQLTDFGTVVAESTSEELDAFKKFTKEKENREKAQIPEEAIDVALNLAANGEDGMKKASFSMDPMLQAETLEYLSSFEGGMEDSDAERNMLQKVLTIREKHQGVDHVDVAVTLVNLAKACRKLGNNRKAKALLERALKIFLDICGEDDALVAITLRNLGDVYADLGDYGHATGVLQRSLKIFVKHLVEDNIGVAGTLQNLGRAYVDLGDVGKAKDVLERALKLKVKHYGPEHFEVAATLTNLGIAHRDLADNSKAKDVLERALKIHVKHYGPYHFEVAITQYNLALTYGNLGDQKKKAEVLEMVLPIFEKSVGVDHVYCAQVRGELDETTRQKQYYA